MSAKGGEPTVADAWNSDLALASCLIELCSSRRSQATKMRELFQGFRSGWRTGRLSERGFVISVYVGAGIAAASIILLAVVR